MPSYRSLIPLGEGIYTVPEVCRILQPGMTSRKVHYWLDTGLLTIPVEWGGRGQPTLLTYQQLLEVRTVQRLRDELRFSLPKVRSAFSWILSQLFTPHWRDLRFGRDGTDLVARVTDGNVVVPGGQQILDFAPLNKEIAYTRQAWETKVFQIPHRPHVVSNARVLAGSPTVIGTRIETSIIASFATDKTIDRAGVAEIVALYRPVADEAIEDALQFEGVQIAA